MQENLPTSVIKSGAAVPDLSHDKIAELLESLYGIAGTITPLAGERDQNCLVETADNRRYVFKVSNPAEPVSVVDFQVAALDHIARISPDQPVPRVVRTLDGQTRDSVTLACGATATVRLLTYLDGIQVYHTNRSVIQRCAMATMLAKLNLALRDFSHPAAAHEDLLWNVSTAHRLTDKLNAIVDAPRRALAESFMNRFTDYVLPRLSALRAQVIHNDYHLYNVLVSPEDHEHMVGIIDFGDMVYAPLIGEVATAAAFQMMGSDDLFEGPGQFIGAYHQTLPLTDAELDLVADLIATRHLITVLITEWRAAQYPENRAYIMKHNLGAWNFLSQLAKVSHDEVRDKLLRQVTKGNTNEKHN